MTQRDRQRVYTPQQVASDNGLPYQAVMQAIHAGALVARRPTPASRRYVILAADLDAWLNDLPIA